MKTLLFTLILVLSSAALAEVSSPKSLKSASKPKTPIPKANVNLILGQWCRQLNNNLQTLTVNEDNTLEFDYTGAKVVGETKYTYEYDPQTKMWKILRDGKVHLHSLKTEKDGKLLLVPNEKVYRKPISVKGSQEKFENGVFERCEYVAS